MSARRATAAAAAWPSASGQRRRPSFGQSINYSKQNLSNALTLISFLVW